MSSLIRHSTRAPAMVTHDHAVSVAVASIFLVAGVTWAVRSTSHIDRDQGTIPPTEDVVRDEVEHDDAVMTPLAEETFPEDSELKETTLHEHVEDILVGETKQQEEQDMSKVEEQPQTIHQAGSSPIPINNGPVLINEDHIKKGQDVSLSRKVHDQVLTRQKSSLKNTNDSVQNKDREELFVHFEVREQAQSTRPVKYEPIPVTPVRKGWLRRLKGLAKSSRKVKDEGKARKHDSRRFE